MKGLKHKIAVIASGWYNRGLADTMKGIMRGVQEHEADAFLFVSYSQFRETEYYNKGEFNIHRLLEYDNFDGVIIMPDTISSPEEAERLRKQLKEDKVPAVSIGVLMKGMGFISGENYNTMKIMVEHLVNVHHIQSAVYMAGHPENRESERRGKAVMDVLTQHGISFTDRDVVYSNWEYDGAKKATREIARRYNGLPDAIICANDYSAMATCIALEEMGYKVPEDTIVTGYDNVNVSRAFYPSLTTMAQPCEQMGYESVKLLYSMVNGGPIEERTAPGVLIEGESCGCEKGNNSELQRRRYCIDSHIQSEENIIFEWTANNIEKAIFRCDRVEKVHGALRDYFESNHEYEGDGFCLLMDPAYKQAIYNRDMKLWRDGYSKKMDVIVAIQSDKAMYIDNMQSKEIIPGYKKDNVSHAYIIGSVHNRANIFGYIVMRDKLDHIEDRSLYAYLSRLGECLEKYRQTMRLNSANEELLELSTKDALTGLYNRFGYERIVKPKFEENHEQGKHNAILFADINRMKYINDSFGHLQGDMAIRTIASVIQECMDKDWMAIRYGGDEFILIGACEDEHTVKYLEERITSTVSKRGSEMLLPYPLSVSCGHMISEPEDETTLAEYVKRADEHMYKNKKRMYEENDELKKISTNRKE